MFLCDVISRVRVLQDALNITWLLCHVFGIAANVYACWLLKRKWKNLGTIKIVLFTSGFSNIVALLVHMYLPVNHMLQNATGLQWNFGTFWCPILPPLANLALAASTLSYLAVALEQYFKAVFHESVSLRDAESTSVLIFVIASLLTAPQFCQCGSVSAPIVGEGNCIQTWQTTYQGHLYEASRLILQYAIPFTVIANTIIKMQYLYSEAEPLSRLRRVLGPVVNVATGITLCLFVYFFPVQALLHAGRDALLEESLVGAMQVLGFLAVFCCIATPFVINQIVTNEERYEGYKFSALIKKTLSEEQMLGELPLGTTKEKASDELSVAPAREKPYGKVLLAPVEKPSDELILSLINDGPLHLKNEMIV